jgi:hypothetical protein
MESFSDGTRKYTILKQQIQDQLIVQIGANKTENKLSFAVRLIHNKADYNGSYSCPAEGDQMGTGHNGPNDNRNHKVRFL